MAQQRAKENGGMLVLRNEDMDSTRYKMEFVPAMMEDLRWFGFEWQEGPDCGGPFAPYNQSERMDVYRAALERLRAGNFIYPCTCSRKDIRPQRAHRTRTMMTSRFILEPAGKIGNAETCEKSRNSRLAFSRS